ncbi:MAG: hypothetical protein A2514_05385 [Gammaproteobacteria bacterium RIFOXYD12_FULL_61_37]|nr:MAG: hypothetical protein A2514_05385 [Gammaproteobacteria bacterium RIFOXYD12_FULL_61_37]
MLDPILVLLALIPSLILLVLWTRWRRLVRAEFIRTYPYPPGLYERLAHRRPGLSIKDRQLVGRALRQFFLAYLNGGRQFVSMPSQVVDDLWHEFILYTRHYQDFCRKAFGRTLHHTPAVVLSPDRRGNEGLRRVWRQCCREENIDPANPSRLPLLFALDAKLGIADGFHYTPDCSALRRGGDGGAHCGGDFSSSSYDGCTDGFGESCSDSGDGGDGGGGCGGD